MSNIFIYDDNITINKCNLVNIPMKVYLIQIKYKINLYNNIIFKVIVNFTNNQPI